LCVDAGQEGYDNKQRLDELIHVAGLCIELLQQNDEYLADVRHRPHRRHAMIDAGTSVCVWGGGTTVTCAKTDESIEMPFSGWTSVSPKIDRWSPDPHGKGRFFFWGGKQDVRCSHCKVWRLWCRLTQVVLEKTALNGVVFCMFVHWKNDKDCQKMQKHVKTTFKT